jgi:cell division protein FtsL
MAEAAQPARNTSRIVVHRHDDAAARPADEAVATLRVVSPRHRRRRAGLAAVVAGVAVFSLMIGIVAFQGTIAKDQLRLDHLQQQTQNAQDRYDRLRAAVARLESPARIVAAAEQLGMSPPTSVNYVTPTPDEVGQVAASTGTAPGAGDNAPASQQDGWSQVKRIEATTP